MTEDNKHNVDQVLKQARSSHDFPSKDVEHLTNEYLKGIKAFESDTVALAKRETLIYKKVAGGASVLAVLAISALAIAMPLKTIELQIVRVNETTGQVDTLRPMADAQPVTYGESLDKHWLAGFIVARNAYEWETVQNSFNTVKLMSDPKVFGAYVNYIQGKESPVETFDEDWVVKIKIEGISFLPNTSPDQVLSQIVFTRTAENGQGQLVTGHKPTKWTATLTSDYKADIKTADERLLNPLGFRVTSYREDRILIND